MGKAADFKPRSHAEADLRDQGLSAHGTEEGRQICQDQEVQGCGQVQGAVQQVPVYALREGPRESRQAEAELAARSHSQGHLSAGSHRERKTRCVQRRLRFYCLAQPSTVSCSSRKSVLRWVRGLALQPMWERSRCAVGVWLRSRMPFALS